MSGRESVPDMMLGEIQRQLAGEIPIISIPGQSSCYSPLAFQRQLVKSCQARGKNKDSIYIYIIYVFPPTNHVIVFSLRLTRIL